MLHDFQAMCKPESMPAPPTPCGRRQDGQTSEGEPETLAAVVAPAVEVILDGASHPLPQELYVAAHGGHAHLEQAGKLRRVGVGTGADGIQYAQVPLEHETGGFLAVRAASRDVARLFGG